MAFPTVQSVTATSFPSTTTSHAVSMPATVNAEDLLLCLFVNDWEIISDATVTVPTGWSELFDQVSSSDGARFGAYVRRADGTEGGTTVDFVTLSAEKAAAQVYRITGWRDSGTLLNDVEAGIAVVFFSNGNPDPPSLDPANWATEDTLWIACYGASNQRTANAAPTNYTNLTDTLSGGTGPATSKVSVASARRELAAASEDPGTFTISSGTIGIVNTIAIRPASAPLPAGQPAILRQWGIPTKGQRFGGGPWN